MRARVIVGGLLILLTASGWSGLNSTQERVLTGGAIGAGVGAVGTLATGGCVICGTAIGGAVGAGVGYVVDQTKR